jgi:hypothetical protein
MIKCLFAAVVICLSASGARADDGNDETPPSAAATSTVSGAALPKGYRTEEAAAAPEPDANEDAPVQRQEEANPLVRAPSQRPLGATARRAASGGEAAASTSAGISCDASEPPLTGGVIRKERASLTLGSGIREAFTLAPNQALSVKFTAPKSGGGGFNIIEATHARWEQMFMTVSKIPCDFDVKKLLASADRGPNFPRAIPASCIGYAPGEGAAIVVMADGQSVPPGLYKPAICFITPGKTYYLNIRTLSTNPTRDACAVSAERLGANLKCGGYLTVSWSGETADKKK